MNNNAPSRVELLQVYPALHRLEAKGWIAASFSRAMGLILNPVDREGQ